MAVLIDLVHPVNPVKAQCLNWLHASIKFRKGSRMTRQVDEIAESMQRARQDTLQLFDMVAEDKLHQSPGNGYRPIMWHLAHIGVYEAYWILQQTKGDPAPDQQYERIFDPIKTPRENSTNLPSRQEMEKFLEGVRKSVLGYLETVRFDEHESQPLLRHAYVFDLVLEHERQHQETLAYLLHLLDPTLKRRPSPPHRASPPKLSSATISSAESILSTHINSMALIPAGSFTLGAGIDGFAYDNERPAHTVHVPAFKLDKLLATNAEYLEFIDAGGYNRHEWWSDEGWAWRERESWSSPLYWARNAEHESEWRVRTMFDEHNLDLQHPVCGVSWYEADAYARFRGKRLPTEAEWEKAAAWDAAKNCKRRFAWGNDKPDSTRCNFDNLCWGTTPVGRFPNGTTPEGCLDMTGNVWEWTADAFRGYPGFTAFPYREYSEEWFDGDHRVLKGGSWATRASVLRTTFRNFFRRHFRIAFAGIRCAADE